MDSKSGKDLIFHWPTIWRHALTGAVPFILAIFACEKFLGEGSLGLAMVVLAALLPFVAVGWLGYQHWRHASGCSREKNLHE